MWLDRDLLILSIGTGLRVSGLWVADMGARKDSNLEAAQYRLRGSGRADWKQKQTTLNPKPQNYSTLHIRLIQLGPKSSDTHKN